MLRKSGIPLMEELPWGGHICLFYENKLDLLDAVAAYFGAGLQAHEYCVWAISEPIGQQEAEDSLRAAIPDFDRYITAGDIEIIPGREWYLKGEKFDMQRVVGGWNEKLQHALARGYEGVRISGNAFWLDTEHWKAFSEYEQELDRSLSGQRMLVLCTYSLGASRAVDILDATHAHNFTLVWRQGEWQFMEMPEFSQASERIQHLNSARTLIAGAFPGHEQLSERERAVLEHIVKGASSKEAARVLGISPRTVDFHRANIIEKLGAKNIADLIRVVLSHR